VLLGIGKYLPEVGEPYTGVVIELCFVTAQALVACAVIYINPICVQPFMVLADITLVGQRNFNHHFSYTITK
jgi:hypothetical protein